jgi:hypothetical protein
MLLGMFLVEWRKIELPALNHASEVGFLHRWNVMLNRRLIPPALSLNLFAPQTPLIGR